MSVGINRQKNKNIPLRPEENHSHGRSQDFSKGGHTDSYRGYSTDCHLNIVGCLLTKWPTMLRCKYSPVKQNILYYC